MDAGMTEGEARYMMSGGTDDTGLTPPPPPEPQADAGTISPVAQPASSPPAASLQPREDEEQFDPSRPIPYEAMHRERERRKDLTRQLAERDTALSDLQQKWARLDERLSIFREATQPQEQMPAAPPDPEQDPFGYIHYLGNQVATLQSKASEYEQRIRETDAARELQMHFSSDARHFVGQQPDFWESGPGAADGAYHYLMANRNAELQAQGYLDPGERSRIIATEERDFVARALMARQNDPRAPGPAQGLYNLARARGFQPRGPGGGGGQRLTANGAANGFNAPPARPQTMTVTEQVANIQRGQAANRSLSSAGGTPAPRNIDIATIANMSDAEFMNWRRTLTPAQMQEYQGLLGAP
jgi:hypothetical protein